MKKLSYLCTALAAALLISVSAPAANSVRIRVLPTTPIRKTINPITVLNNTVDKIELLFNATLGQVSIEAYDEMSSTVYSDNVQAVGGGMYYIPIADWEPGNYNLTVVAKGRSYTWELELSEE